MTPDSWVDPDYHWQPPADQLYAYDPAKAKDLLDAAGYKDADGDGIREGKDGKPIKLRLWARAESPESQKTGSLLTGWFRDLGLKIEYQVMDDGIYYDSIWAYEGDTYSPDFDMYLWDYDGYADPGDTLASFTTRADRELERAVLVRRRVRPGRGRRPTASSTRRSARTSSGRRSRSSTSSRRRSCSTTRRSSRPSNTARWDGWTRMYGGTGAAFYTSFVRDSYINLKPKAAASTRRLGARRRDDRDRRRHRRDPRGARSSSGCCCRRRGAGRGGVSRRPTTAGRRTRSLPARLAA